MLSIATITVYTAVYAVLIDYTYITVYLHNSVKTKMTKSLKSIWFLVW